MFSKLENLYHFIDESIESIYQKHPKEIRCKKGCADCCHAVFNVSFIEAAYIAGYLAEHRDICKQQQEIAHKSALEFEELVKKEANPSTERIRCPFLSDNDLCLGHIVRPINCRTYGTPTIIDGKAHVCGLSGFDDKQQYTTVDLAPLQKSLEDYSVELVGEDFGRKRYPLSWVFLKTEFFLPR